MCHGTMPCFCYPQSHTFDEVVKHLALLENTTHQHGVWGFRNPTQERGPVVMHEGQIECMYKALADLVIVSIQPLGSSLAEELRWSTRGLLRAAFVSGERYDLVAGSRL